MGYTARWAWEELEITETNVSTETPIEPDLSQSEVSGYLASGVLTQDAWNAHLQGMAWEIRLSSEVGHV